MKACIMKKVYMVSLLVAGAIFAPSLAQATQTWWMRGGNWADARDNFLDSRIIPSGLTGTSTVAQAQSKADQIANDIKGITDSNGRVVRLGINPQTVSDASFWPVYTAAIDRLVADGLHVILCCWDGSDANGVINNTAAWKTMWQKVASKYNSNNSVWFEPFNEPHGYSSSSLISLYNDYLSWIGKSQGRIILAGTGYSTGVTTIGAAFSGTKLGLHTYAWFNSYTTESAWAAGIKSSVGSYADRTLITETGVPATTGLNYGASSSDSNVTFFRGVTTETRALTIGVVYWPSHRDGDTFRLFNNTTGGGVTNASLRDRLRYGWNF